MLSRDVIFGVQDLKIEKVAVPEWGGDVCVRMMRGFERDAFETALMADDKKNTQNIRARLAVLTVCDETGQRLFTDADATALGEKSAAALQRIFDAASRLNVISQKDVEELEKNSVTGQSAGSGKS